VRGRWFRGSLRSHLNPRHGVVVVPYTSAYLAEGPRTTNVTIQDLCPTEVAEHVLIPMSPTSIAVTLDALTRPGPADPAYRPACVPALP
jgi:triacylglycerol lipase